MTAQTESYSVLFPQDDWSSRNSRWLICALLALAFHILLLVFRPDFLSPPQPLPVELGGIDQQTLDAVKKQWTKQDRFLISNAVKDPDATAPKDARFSSSENRSVEKEMKARDRFTTPKTGILGPGIPNAGVTNPKTKPIPLAKLSNLTDIADPLRRPKPVPNDESPEGEREGKKGGGESQYVDDDVPMGAENILNTAESIYHSFYSRMYESIGPAWSSRIREVTTRVQLKQGIYETLAEIRFDSDGNYIGYELIRSSGIDAFDEAVPYAWKKLPRFPNPPKHLIGPDGILRMKWAFTVYYQQDTGFQFAPPQRIDE